MAMTHISREQSTVGGTAGDSPVMQHRKARENGHGRDSCPYPEGSPERQGWLGVWMRDVRGARDDLKGLGQAAGIERRVVMAVDARWGCAEALAHGPLGCAALEHALAAGIVGLIEAPQQDLQIAVAGNRDAQHLPLHPPVEALD